MRISIRNYARYKFFNSIFGGLSIGAIFTIYAPLKPSVFSIGGIVLAVLLLVVAKFYDRLIQIRRFFIISLLIEVVMLSLVAIYIFFPIHHMTALVIYVGYQLTFAFGSYLVRAETLFVRRKKLLSFVDISKQLGYLCGLALSWLFFKVLESYGVAGNSEQIYDLHYLLVLTEVVIIYFLLKAFRSSKGANAA